MNYPYATAVVCTLMAAIDLSPATIGMTIVIWLMAFTINLERRERAH